MKIVHGKPRHSQSQGSVERANQDIENMLGTWMKDHISDQWSQVLRFVRFMKNRDYHSGIKRTPYEALLGCKPIVGLPTSSLPQDILKDINTEGQIEKIIEANRNMDEIIVDGGLNQHDYDMFTEDISVPATCCMCLKETSDAHACTKCRKKS
ncbi:hypothetical protein AVEN_126109-1 [Araneus ventricosus]|uniref:Integrase catalytic domain-containing protein n=1 Tax=Araneus ventricosus TaxID=182803 RepID=A0A4Y2CM16_ARAVE|nr:hypothetical protein AVEN_126109-1 [Araneus ventricosus]